MVASIAYKSLTMSYEIITQAIQKGAVLYPNVSGGKDGQAMVKMLLNARMPIAGLVHADLGRTEWIESRAMCERIAAEAGVPLHTITRSDGRDMIDHWYARLLKLKGTGQPFWSSSKMRYCTSDMKRDPINRFYRNCGHDFIISCEGIRAQESTARSKKIPLAIRRGMTSTYYAEMSVEEAILNYKPGKKLALTWYPIFNYSISDVWSMYDMNTKKLEAARWIYQHYGFVSKMWPFHPAYVYGNERVSCVFCILGCGNDLGVGAKHRPELLDLMISMEEEGNATFKHNFSLKQLLQ